MLHIPDQALPTKQILLVPNSTHHILCKHLSTLKLIEVKLLQSICTKVLNRRYENTCILFFNVKGMPEKNTHTPTKRLCMYF